MDKVIEFLKKRYIWVTCLSVIIVLVIFVGFVKKGTFSVDENPVRLVLTCPEVTELPDSNSSDPKYIDCEASLELDDDFSLLWITAKYDLGEGITYESFTNTCDNEGSCFEVFTATEEGFIVNSENVTGTSAVLGTLRLELPSNAAANQTFDIGLDDIEIWYGEGDDDKYDQADIDTQVRIANNDATSGEIYIEGLQWSYSGFENGMLVRKYNVYGDTSSVQFVYSTADPNATISGSGTANNGLVSLEYGENEFMFIVTAEDGITTKEYKVIVQKIYVFNQNIYDFVVEDHGIIYTAADTDAEIIANLYAIDNSVYYEVDGGGLHIYKDANDDDSIMDITLARVGVGIFSINGKKIYINDNVTLGDIIDHSYNVDVYLAKGFSGNWNVVTDLEEVVESIHELGVRYRDSIVNLTDEPYAFVVRNNSGETPGETPGEGEETNITFDKLLHVEENNSVIAHISIGTTVVQLEDMIQGATSVAVTTKCGSGASNVARHSIIKTGYCVILNNDDELKYELSVLGDYSGDGIIELNDVGMLYRDFRSHAQMSRAKLLAGDISGDGVIDLNDSGMLYRNYYYPTRGGNNNG